MRAVVQRVGWARVSVAGDVIGAVEQGLCVLVGVGRGDTKDDVVTLADKVIGLRIFEDESGRMNRSVADVGGAILAVSQFTLFGDVRRGKRPSFTQAMEPDLANQYFEAMCARMRASGVVVETGRFGARMVVELANEGPVTILLDTKKAF
jgi:D-tyrosyl-tRNA(Tyr) deacylase